ncbi:MAG TPA: hypothetical protein VFQ14_02055 [Thermoleophilaceae bacterium]|nr:hypothetical protein [Thermoleophilaceae bacterium]
MGLAITRRLALALTALLIAGGAFALPAVVPADAAAQVAGQQVDDEEPGDGFDDPEDDFGFDDEELIGEEDYVDEQVAALEQATGELGRAKRAAASKVARLSGSSSTLRPCLRGGPGWKRIRAVKHASQRSLYTAAARRLLADMKLLLDGQQPRIVVYESAFQRFVANLRAAPVSDPTLSAAIAAQARRVSSYRDLRAVKANCAVFNKLTKRVREFPTRTAAQIVRADYRSAPLARKIERNISDQLTRLDRRHGIDYRDAETLADAAELMVERGGEPGYATGFQYALSLR